MQGTGIVKFLHLKNQCYVAGEGSFVGKFGILPDFEVTEETPDRTPSIENQESTLQVEVPADTESAKEYFPSPSQPHTCRSPLRSLLNDGPSASLSPSSFCDDEVVLKDGNESDRQSIEQDYFPSF